VHHLHLQGSQVSQARNQQEADGRQNCLLDAGFSLTHYLILKMEAIHSSQMLMDIYVTTQLYNLELHTLHIKDLLYNFSVQTLTCKFPIIYMKDQGINTDEGLSDLPL
jgi:hypothetical protein